MSLRYEPSSEPLLIFAKYLFLNDKKTEQRTRRAFVVKVAAKRLPVFPFSGFDLYHHFRNDAFYGLDNLLNVRKTGKRVIFLQPLPQTLYAE